MPSRVQQLTRRDQIPFVRLRPILTGFGLFYQGFKQKSIDGTRKTHSR